MEKYNIAKYFDTYFERNVKTDLTLEQAQKEIENFKDSSLTKYYIKKAA
jgi:hypothetical protein